MPVLTRLHIVLGSYAEDRRTLYFSGDKQFSFLTSYTAHMREVTGHHMEKKKGSSGCCSPVTDELWQDIQGPLPKLSPPRDYAGSAGPCASIEEGLTTPSARWFVEFQHALDGTELEEKLPTFLPSHSLTSGQVCKIWECRWKFFWPT